MNNRQIETSREVRLWLGQIVIPVITGVMILSPEARTWVKDKINNGARNIKEKISKFKKKD